MDCFYDYSYTLYPISINQKNELVLESMAKNWVGMLWNP